ncbi:MAG: DUF86 domain-containing protein [Candidatus Hydrothermarchaeota archaeon]|nr:MAG: DUF86 domain-containing protein [Candidatus Hydrothermarchaeota archaeon]
MKRIEQYSRKIEYILTSLEKMDFPENEKDVYALFYLLHTSIEAAMDITAMLVKDLGSMPRDDYENIETLYEKGLIDKEFAENLKKLNGLRNILVHRYNKVDENLVVRELNNIKEILNKFIDVVENVIQRIF